MHAYLIVGGNLETRQEKLEEVLSQNGIGQRPGERFNLGVDSEDSLKIEDVREAEVWTGLVRKKLSGLIVEEADRLTTPAQHAFLKTLEEPGENILIVLTGADTSGLLPTVRSRCKIIRLPAVPISAGAGEKYQILLKGKTAERLAGLYPILKEITGSAASLHRGTVKRQEGLMFLESLISSLRHPERAKRVEGSSEAAKLGMTLEAAVKAHRRLKNNLNPTLTLHQFVMDISR